MRYYYIDWASGKYTSGYFETRDEAAYAARLVQICGHEFADLPYTINSKVIPEEEIKEEEVDDGALIP